MRLIDADKLVEELREVDDEIVKACICLVQTQATAYDVEKVVEALEAEKFEIPDCRFDVDLNSTIDDAVDIVRRGGIDE